ncbi:MAG: D-alanyl-D-alanine carboxypeptidase family protein [Pseudomonadota bacterium]
MRLTLGIGRRNAWVLIALMAVSLCVAIQALPAHAQSFNTSADQAFLIDLDTRAVLLEKSADEPMVPASMAKLMTIELVFAALQDGRISMQDEVLISERAWRMRGSRMFAEVGSEITIENLIQGVIVHSGNDAAVALAEAMAGSEEAFAEMMTQRAAELGMTNTRFANSTGLSDPAQLTTARDMATLAIHLIETYPSYYHYFAQPDFTWNDINQRNRNPLLNRDIGVDGLKTGQLDESGYGLVASAVQDGQRVVLVVHGLSTARQREDEAFKILTWGLRTFEPLELYAAGEEVARVPIYGGAVDRVGATGERPVVVMVERGVERADLRGRLVYEWPVEPPVEPGNEIALLRVFHEERIVAEVPLFAMESVEEGAIHRRALDSALEFFAQMLQ